MIEGLFQPMHMLVILVIALIFFGPGKLPELGEGLGKGIREFKKAMADAAKDIEVAPEVKAAPKEVASTATNQMKQETDVKENAESKKETAV